jgi:replicative DNA helicase
MTDTKMRFDEAPIEEAATIGAMLAWDGPWPVEVYRLQAEHFRNEHCAKIYLAIDAIRGDVGPVDVVDLRNKLREFGYRYLDSELLELADRSPASSNLDHWAGLITDAWQRGEISRVTREAIERGDNASQAAAAIGEALSGMEDANKTSGLVHISRPLAKVIRDLALEADEPASAAFVKTGLLDLDRYGKLKQGQLTIIAGRPSMGKSSLAGNIAAHCAVNLNSIVALFSLEMETSDFIRRMISSHAKAKPDDLPSMAKAGKLLDTADFLHHLNLYIDDRPRLGIPAIRSALTRFKSIRLVVVDYLQLAEMDRKLERHDLRLGAITKGLKAIAKDFECHVIALSQLNRGVEKRENSIPTMADLRNSGEIEEDADNVWLLYRPNYYDKTKPERMADIILGKQRFGKTGVVHVSWDPDTQTFGNLAREQQ